MPGTTSTSVTLTWTAPGDDGLSGTAAAYDVRYSLTPILTDADFAAATQATGEPVPSPAGSPETMTVTGLAMSTTYYFAIVALDEAGNVSALCTDTQTTGTTQPCDDVTAPEAITDLECSNPMCNEITLTWTSPHEDGAEGGATASFDLRYSTSPIVTDADFDAATQVDGEPVPAPPGEQNQMTVMGLPAGTTFYFAIKSVDETGNVSPLSNVVTCSTQPMDTTAPCPITDLSVSDVFCDMVTLHWTAPGDDDSVGTATSYEVRFSIVGPILTEADWNAATPDGPPPIPSPAGSAESMVVHGLSPLTTYWFAIRATDEAGNQAALGNSPSAMTVECPDTTCPAAVTDLYTDHVTTTTIELKWTAPGDDGMVGQATSYDIRYSLAPITSDALFAAATQVIGEPAPSPAGTPEVFIVTGLNPGTTYWFALKTSDETMECLSELSNSPSGMTLPLPVDGAIEEEEPNNDCEHDGDLPFDRIGHGHLPTFADVDFWGFDAAAGDLIQIELYGTEYGQHAWDSTNSIPILTIFDEDGNEIIRHDRNAWLNGMHDLDFPIFRAPKTGHYCVRVQASNGNHEDREYSIRFTQIPGDVVLEAEPKGVSGENDNKHDAQAIPVPARVYGWHVRFESDWYEFEACEGDIINLEIFGERMGVQMCDTYFNPRLWLVDPHGHVVACESRTIFEDVAFSFMACKTGTWKVRVLEDAGSNSDGPYVLDVSVQREKHDCFEGEPNDECAQANPIAYGGLVQATICGQDVDWFKFFGIAGDMVRLKIFDQVNNQCACASVCVELFASDCVTPLNFQGPDGINNTIRTMLTQDGTVYIKVTGQHATHYALQLELYKHADIETESNDTPGSAQALDANGRAFGVISSPGDVDVFTFEREVTLPVTIDIYAADAKIPPGSNADFQLAGWGSSLHPQVVVRDAAGDVIYTARWDTSNVSSQGITTPTPTMTLQFNVEEDEVGPFTVSIEDQDHVGGPTAYYVIDVH